MHYRNSRRAFTLIELLTVIAIIALLVAILFPVFGTMREQARQTQCITQMHQLQVAAKLYREDEGAFPPSLHGWAENADGTFNTTGTGAVDGKSIIHGFLYREQVKDFNAFRCPDSVNPNPRTVVLGHIPPKPANWPATIAWVGDTLGTICPSDGAGVVDCYTSGPLVGMPKYYYKDNSYDIGPRLNVAGQPVTLGGAPVYDIHYRVDWTGASGQSDWPAQLKYQNPPDDRTLLTFCSYHCATNKSGRVPAVNLGGSAKVIAVKKFVENGPMVLN